MFREEGDCCKDENFEKVLCRLLEPSKRVVQMQVKAEMQAVNIARNSFQSRDSISLSQNVSVLSIDCYTSTCKTSRTIQKPR
jgi:hypothetical protein